MGKGGVAVGNHNHHGHCQHVLSFCERCDRPYCVKCNREWYAYSSWYPSWTYTTPTPWGTTTSTGATTTLSYQTEVSDHSGH